MITRLSRRRVAIVIVVAAAAVLVFQEQLASMLVIWLITPAQSVTVCDHEKVHPTVDNATWICFAGCNRRLARASISSFGCSVANKWILGDLEAEGARQLSAHRFSRAMESRWAKSIGADRCTGTCLHVDGDVLLLGTDANAS